MMLGCFLRAGRYEVKKDPRLMNFMTDEGFWNAIALARRVRPRDGIQTFATVCSTWVWISRSSTGRSLRNVLGNVRSEVVAEANAMVSRMVLLILFLCARCVAWLLEQPATSLMAQHPRMVMLKELSERTVGLTGFHEVHTSMGAFGAATKKPTRLYSSEEWVHEMRRAVPRDFARDPKKQTVKIAKGGKVTGGPDLKETQAYPDEYGRALLRSWQRNLKTARHAYAEDEISEDSEEFEEDAWADCELFNMLAGKGVRRDAMPF